jgi:hypothetical protein
MDRSSARGRRGKLRLVFEHQTEASDAEGILQREFWRAPTVSPLRLVWTARR